MKFTRKQQLAYDRGRLLKAEPLNEMCALREEVLKTGRKLTNKEQLMTWRCQLVWKTEEVFQRQLRIAIYRRAIQMGDKEEARNHRIDGLDTPTKRLVERMVNAYEEYNKWRIICRMDA